MQFSSVVQWKHERKKEKKKKTKSCYSSFVSKNPDWPKSRTIKSPNKQGVLLLVGRFLFGYDRAL